MSMVHPNQGVETLDQFYIDHQGNRLFWKDRTQLKDIRAALQLISQAATFVNHMYEYRIYNHQMFYRHTIKIVKFKNFYYRMRRDPSGALNESEESSIIPGNELQKFYKEQLEVIVYCDRWNIPHNMQPVFRQKNKYLTLY